MKKGVMTLSVLLWLVVYVCGGPRIAPVENGMLTTDMNGGARSITNLFSVQIGSFLLDETVLQQMSESIGSQDATRLVSTNQWLEGDLSIWSYSAPLASWTVAIPAASASFTINDLAQPSLWGTYPHVPADGYTYSTNGWTLTIYGTEFRSFELVSTYGDFYTVSGVCVSGSETDGIAVSNIVLTSNYGLQDATITYAVAPPLTNRIGTIATVDYVTRATNVAMIAAATSSSRELALAISNLPPSGVSASSVTDTVSYAISPMWQAISNTPAFPTGAKVLLDSADSNRLVTLDNGVLAIWSISVSNAWWATSEDPTPASLPYPLVEGFVNDNWYVPIGLADIARNPGGYFGTPSSSTSAFVMLNDENVELYVYPSGPTVTNYVTHFVTTNGLTQLIADNLYAWWQEKQVELNNQYYSKSQADARYALKYEVASGPEPLYIRVESATNLAVEASSYYVDLVSWAATNITWPANVNWHVEPELTVTGRYLFAFTGYGSRLVGKQNYPTVYQYTRPYEFYTVNTLNMISEGTTQYRADVVNSTSLSNGAFVLAICDAFPVDSIAYIPYHRNLATTNRVSVSIGYTAATIAQSPTVYEEYGVHTNALTEPIEGYAAVYIKRPTTTNKKYPMRYKISVSCTPPSTNFIARLHGMSTKTANELEVNAFNAGWRP